MSLKKSKNAFSKIAFTTFTIRNNSKIIPKFPGIDPGFLQKLR